MKTLFSLRSLVTSNRSTKTASAAWLSRLSAGMLLALSCELGVEPLRGADPIPLKDLDGHFPMKVPSDLEAWKQRSESLRTQILVSQGLWPKPNFAPVKPVVHSEQKMDGYIISKCYFESLPGLFVTGTLYLPLDGLPEGTKRPAVLCPHGHWDNGRFYWANDNEVKNLLATGAERFESAARNHMQARCVQLARMGCVVFQYDMLGYADSQQIDFNRAHRFGLAGPNPQLEDDGWLLYSPTAEGHLQSTMGLQTINTLQSFEFLASRPDVDPSKIAITGASGGGTQTFIAAALEPRIAAAMPAVMVSARMQGGCTCENASMLRVGTGNVEIAALIAPRPLGMTAADDWTKTMPTDGFPELKKVYEMFGAKDRVQLFPALHFPHNYNHVARVALYGFINRSFGLGLKEPILERDFLVQTREQLTVWDALHPAPEGGPSFEAKLLRYWANDTALQIAKNPEIASVGRKVLWSPAMALSKQLQVIINENGDKGEFFVQNSNGESVATGKWNGPLSKLSIHSLSGGQQLVEPARGELSIAVGDAYGYSLDREQPLVKNPRPAAAYTYGYNPPAVVRRVAALVAALQSLESKIKPSPLSVDASVAELRVADGLQTLLPAWVKELPPSTRSEPPKSIRDLQFLPGSLRYESR